MVNLIKCSLIEKLIYENKNVKNSKNIFNNNKLEEEQQKWLEEKLKKNPFDKRIRLLYYIGESIDNEEMLTKVFTEIKDTIVNDPLNMVKYNDKCKIVKERQEINLPLRVNFAGGWTDTPPYCLEKGGKVLNASILLKGQKPVFVCIEKIKEKKIAFLAKDTKEFGEFTQISQIQNYEKEFESFTMIKSCLIICGIIPKTGGNFEEILERFGSGFIIQYEVLNTPRGSGLGTASILYAAIVKAILEFFGIEYNDNDIVNKVLQIEQILSTGGGWQDTIGGLCKGIKLISSEKGIYQKCNIKNLNISKNTLEELEKRFLLINTGERRLSRTLLKGVVKRYIGNEEETLTALNEIKNISDKMAQALEDGNIDSFASLLNKHWEYSLKIIPETATNLINGIFSYINEYIDGKMICGPGGGGFLQIILKKGISPNVIREKIKEIFDDSEITVWESSFV